MDLHDKVAIVTGASRGIGRQIALALAEQGATVVVAARTVEPRRRQPGTIGETLATIEAGGATAMAMQVDVTQPGDLERLIDSTIKRFGRIDVLVNNAAVTQADVAPIEERTIESWHREFDANIHAPFLLIKRVIPHLKAVGGGMIVNITSGTADLLPARETIAARRDPSNPISLPTQLGYATTKAALNRMTNALAPDLAPFGIGIVAVDPGFTRTELVDLLDAGGYVDATTAGPMSSTVDVVLSVITDDDPLRSTGEVLRAQPHQLPDGRLRGK
jgi:NAD(P)-dependent dehydrogenase (short-subunit alcohol dehydrogenase family)